MGVTSAGVVEPLFSYTTVVPLHCVCQLSSLIRGFDKAATSDTGRYRAITPKPHNTVAPGQEMSDWRDLRQSQVSRQLEGMSSSLWLVTEAKTSMGHESVEVFLHKRTQKLTCDSLVRVVKAVSGVSCCHTQRDRKCHCVCV